MEQDSYGPGDLLEVTTQDRAYTGTFIPQEGDTLVLKLKSGYNVGILKKNVQRVQVLSPAKEKSSAEKQVEQNRKLPKVSILHTGGTIASKVDYETGGVVAQFSPEELLSMFPELQSMAHVRTSLIANMSSDDMRFDHYNMIAEAIQKEIGEGATGIIITQGTDNLHVSAAAVSFILQDLTIPVLFLGAQRSSDRGSSDAAMNLICAVEAIVKSDFAGVGVCMHATTNDNICHILPGTKCRKMHASRRDAFQPVNATPYMTVNYDSREIVIIDSSYARKDITKAKQCKALPINTSLKVGLCKIHTHMYASQFEAFRGFDGLVLEGTGLGHAPINNTDDATGEHDAIAQVIKDLASSAVVAMTPQTIYGRVCLNVYSPGRKLQSLGVIGNLCDMHAETAHVKLAWLLSHYSKEEVKQKYLENLRGEIKKHTPPEQGYF